MLDKNIMFVRKAQKKISQRLPKMHFVAPNVIRTSANVLFQVIKVNGVHISTSSTDNINEKDNEWHSIVTSLDDEFPIWATMIRRKVSSDFNVSNYSEFTHEFSEKYRNKYKNAQLYRNEYYLTVYYTGMTGLVKNISSIFSKKNDAIFQTKISEAVGRLTSKVEEIVTRLGSQKKDEAFSENSSIRDEVTSDHFNARVLDQRECETSEIMSFLGTFVNGLESLSYKYPTEPMFGYRDTQIPEPGFSKFPYGNIGEFLGQNEPAFGDKRYFAFKHTDGSKKIGNILSIKKYGSGTTPITFHQLMALDCEFMYTVSFAPMETKKAEQETRKKLAKMKNAKDKAKSQQAAIEMLEDDIASERVLLGSSHCSLMVLADNKEELNSHTNQVIKLYGQNDFRAFPEEINHISTFWAQFPGNTKYIKRERLLTSDVFCHFFPLHNFPTGHTHQTHLGEGLCLVDTPSKTPMFFNYHEPEKGASKNDKCPGSGVLVGGNKSGKTTLLLAMDALAEKYNQKTYFFDRDGGGAIYMWATGNNYYEFDQDNIRNINLNVFSLPDTRVNRAFIANWLCGISRDEDESSVPSDVKELFTEVVNYAYTLDLEQRSLSNVLNSYVGPDFKRWSNLRLWLRGDDYRDDGAFAEYFDNDIDELDFDSQMKIGFDMTHVLSKGDMRLGSALLSYNFHRILTQKRESGQPICIILDEGWFMLRDPWIANMLEELIPTIRKENIYIIVATQSPETVLASPVADQFLANIAFSIFFANSKADPKVYEKYNIDVAEFQTIKTTPRAKRHFIFKQGHESAVCKLDLSGFNRELAVLSTNTDSKEVARRIRKKHGLNPKPELWLESFYEELGVSK
jgi:type IV secretion system protein VirB4